MSTPTAYGEAQSASSPSDHRTAIVIVRLGDVRCGLSVDAIKEITRAVAITPLPSAPRGVEGIVDYHGEITPVIDLRDRLGLPPREELASDHLVFAQTGRRLCAFRVDEASEVAHIDGANVVEARAVVMGTRAVAGIIRTPDGLVLLQDLGAMLSQAEEERLATAMADVAAATTDD